MSENIKIGGWETQQAIRAMEERGHDPLVDDTTFDPLVDDTTFDLIARTLEPKDKSQMTPKQKLIEAVKSIKEPVHEDETYSQWQKGYESACDNFLKLIEEILP